MSGNPSDEASARPAPEAPVPAFGSHVPVLLRETLAALDLRPGLVVVDGTIGAGGHSRRIVEAIRPGGRLIGLDRDPMMLRLAEAALGTSADVILRHASYAQLPAILDELSIPAVDRVLVDLGLSSDQLADRSRGFGFRAGGRLDLRFDTSQGTPASELLRTMDARELASTLRRFGEERQADRIAQAIVARRALRPIETAEDLAGIVAAAAGGPVRGGHHPATRVFQALRIAVNDELSQLEHLLRDVAPERIASGGRLAVISFHSLEDRLVKDTFRETERWEPHTKKPVAATPAEERLNPRSRSAKLRVARRR